MRPIQNRPGHFPVIFKLGDFGRLEGFTKGDREMVQKAHAEHHKVVLNLVNEQIRSETERKEMVRRIRKTHPPLKKPRNKGAKKKIKISIVHR